MDEQHWTANHVPIPGKIRRCKSDEDFLVVEDIYGNPIAYALDDVLARLCFAAPGMLNTMGRLAAICRLIAGSTLDQKIKLEIIELMKDANLALDAAREIEII
ncbi:MAG: hypothetical protein HQL78_13960 [Magnetococcales bacterium]|nr:hypothetical protein [Magnetococcales bacterium]